VSLRSAAGSPRYVRTGLRHDAPQTAHVVSRTLPDALAMRTLRIVVCALGILLLLIFGKIGEEALGAILTLLDKSGIGLENLSTLTVFVVQNYRLNQNHFLLSLMPFAGILAAMPFFDRLIEQWDARFWYAFTGVWLAFMMYFCIFIYALLTPFPTWEWPRTTKRRRSRMRRSYRSRSYFPSWAVCMFVLCDNGQRPNHTLRAAPTSGAPELGVEARFGSRRFVCSTMYRVRPSRYWRSCPNRRLNHG